ncbi:MAG: GNAT family N-acetyltransferase [Vulcanimicrobiaceae bacterium]
MDRSEEQHRNAIGNSNFRYLLCDGPEGVRGYAILAGLAMPHRSIEIIRIVSAGKGFGVGGDLFETAVRHAFLDLGAHRMWSDCFDDNLPVRRTCAHFGFREEGILRDAAFYDGRFRSIVLLGLLETEAFDVLAKR